MSNVNFVDLIRRNPLRIACGVLSLMAVVGTYLAYTWLEDTGKDLEQKRTQGELLAANVRNSAQLNEHLDALTAAGAKIQGRLVQADELATNLQYFYRLETESGVKLIDLRQTTTGEPAKATTKGKKPSPSVGFALSLEGDYASLIDWLRRLENGPYFCRVMTAGVGAPLPDRTAPLVLTLTLELLGQP